MEICLLWLFLTIFILGLTGMKIGTILSTKKVGQDIFARWSQEKMETNEGDVLRAHLLIQSSSLHSKSNLFLYLFQGFSGCSTFFMTVLCFVLFFLFLKCCQFIKYLQNDNGSCWKCAMSFIPKVLWKVNRQTDGQTDALLVDRQFSFSGQTPRDSTRLTGARFLPNWESEAH